MRGNQNSKENAAGQLSLQNKIRTSPLELKYNQVRGKHLFKKDAIEMESERTITDEEQTR